MPIALPPELGELETAEEFLAHFAVRYDPHVVRVSRLHILQRFHDYLAQAEDPGEAATLAAIKDLLVRAYEDFVRSDPLTERVFKVLKAAQARPEAPPGRVFVPLSAITRRQPAED
jgi:nitrogenase-stabilizing/protective protein